MANAKRKLKDFKACRQKLGVNKARTGEVAKCVNDIVEAFDDYVKNDNLDGSVLFSSKLKIKIEEHGDFGTAVNYLDAAIRNAEEEVRREEEAERERIASLLKGGI